jgi:hypothetical protein
MQTCPGPCNLDFTKYAGGANYPDSAHPAATYKRGQMVNIKYNRNNHPCGGFVRMTLVPADKVMDKAAHEKGAFHYSCWGAGVTVATPAQIAKDDKGFNIIGNDGEQHSQPPAFYSTDVIIPDVVPDGDYVLGWVWFGGTGGDPSTIRNDGSTKPGETSYFGDVSPSIQRADYLLFLFPRHYNANE